MYFHDSNRHELFLNFLAAEIECTLLTNHFNAFLTYCKIRNFKKKIECIDRLGPRILFTGSKYIKISYYNQKDVAFL